MNLNTASDTILMTDISSKADAVLDKARKLVTPSESEVRKLEAVVSNVRGRIEATFDAEKADPTPKISLGGSYARGTWLKGNHDVDFFLLYPVDFSREKLETVAIKSASEAMDGYQINMRYAEHPYVESFVEGVRINIVPCYDVAPGDWRSAADRSPYHTKYITSKMDERLRLEARLLKKFVKASQVYGAEVRIQGFSGYVCEVFTLRFGSFLETLSGISKAKPGDVISLEEYDSDLAATFSSPIKILDPVDTTRNLGSAVSARNVGRLVISSRRFLSRPAISYFLIKRAVDLSKIPIKSRQFLLPRILVLIFRNEKRSPDILWGELKRSSSSLSEKISKLGFQVLRASAASNEKEKSALLFLLSGDRVENLTLRAGPDYFRAEEVGRYYEKNRSRALLTWMGNEGKVESVFGRDERLVEAQSAIKTMLQKNNIDEIGLSTRVKSEISKGFRISNARQISKGKVEDWLAKEIVELCSGD